MLWRQIYYASAFLRAPHVAPRHLYPTTQTRRPFGSDIDKGRRRLAMRLQRVLVLEVVARKVERVEEFPHLDCTIAACGHLGRSQIVGPGKPAATLARLRAVPKVHQPRLRAQGGRSRGRVVFELLIVQWQSREVKCSGAISHLLYIRLPYNNR